MAPLFAQTRTVSGQVTSHDDGSALPGVSVVIKGTTTGTITDVKGQYTIQVRNENEVLVFSYVGFITQEIKVKDRQTIDVVLKTDGRLLEEVVVVGYGTVTQQGIMGSVSIPAKGKKHRGAKPPGPTLSHRPSGEGYTKLGENPFQSTKREPLSTFSIDVDAASYANLRRMINNGQQPPTDAVRIEEMINYFGYDYPQPTDGHPFSITTEAAPCPWNPQNQLVLIGLQGKKIATENLPPNNLVFLIDVSGSMSDEHKLPLLKSAFKLLVKQLREQDRVAIVVYAGAAGVVLPSTAGSEKTTILTALDRLEAGGSTAGGQGIELAYRLAADHFLPNGNNRIILATDGDFNVGPSNRDQLEDLIVAKRETGIYITCLGFGMGNLQDGNLETLANKGNGNYAYIDNLQEANKVFVKEMGGTLLTIAKDVKIQVEFNPAQVRAYRLIGYENRLLNEEDFKNDKKDAGELGAGHSVTALYEVEPANGNSAATAAQVTELKYQTAQLSSAAASAEWLTVKFRYKPPQKGSSIELVHTLTQTTPSVEAASENLRFAASVALFGMLLRQSAHVAKGDYATVLRLAKSARGADPEGYRAEFTRLVEAARAE
ncbi:MAG: von Willebrand factor type A domain-containing protein [Bernardetiaceae bacterium]|nr:von Willebrand factor type A domain-containing protein [Bernardetiaceae bacterium]